MQLKHTSGTASDLIEILGDNGQPASAANPINRNEYSSIDFPDVMGKKVLVVSGMPMSAVTLVSLHYKNVYSAIAIANPREGVAEIVHSVSPDYQVGGAIPLA